jgi:hypothetical protein
MFERNGSQLHATASFTVFVRNCGWLIQTMETNEIGNICRREIGSTNGNEIHECEWQLGRVSQTLIQANTESSRTSTNKASSAAMLAVIVSNNIPVGETDSAVVGHLWLMLASQCYWPNLQSDRLTPIYDWRASVGAQGQNRKVSAGWDLLSGLGSLPREVRYLGLWGETNGLYTITGTNVVEGVLIPGGFIFKQFRIGPVNETTFTHEMTLIKHVDVAVTAVRPGCSVASLIPSPEGPAVIVDERFNSGTPNRPPSYQNPVIGQWPGIEQSKVLAKVQQTKDLQTLNQMDQLRMKGQSNLPPHRSKVVFIVMCILVAAPPIIYFVLQRLRKS